ncbi:MAG: NUDIX domain-containing protein [Congregibacter sp.]
MSEADAVQSVRVRPASTIALLRDGAGDSPEVLMVRRNRALVFAGGFWVFPGGAVDDVDRAQSAGDADVAARFAAAREAKEEAGVSPDPDNMVLLSHWTTPVGEMKRFSTWFYAGAIDADDEVEIDGSEIHDFEWLDAKEALGKHARGELPMMPPTYITLCAIARYKNAQAALEGERRTPCPRVLPVMVAVDSTDEEGSRESAYVTLYPGDAGYDLGELQAGGPRHCSSFENGSWQYHFDGVTDAMPLYPMD